MSTKYFKNQCRPLSEQTFARLQCTDSEEFENTSMLIVGYMMNTGMPFAIYNLRYEEQTYLSSNDYKHQWSSIQGWLKEIDKEEFEAHYKDACDYILNESEDSGT